MYWFLHYRIFIVTSLKQNLRLKNIVQSGQMRYLEIHTGINVCYEIQSK